MALLSAFQRSRIRKLSTTAPPEEAGELNVVPFLDIITNVMMFVLATVAVTFTSTTDITPPRATPGRNDPTKPLGLTIAIVDDGFAIKAAGGNVAPGCRDTGAGLAVPKNDFAALHACAETLKHTFADDTNVTLTANPAIRYETVVATMDALRATDDGKDLFPDVNLAVVR
jgi:biopolymer transport protein ExbD